VDGLPDRERIAKLVFDDSEQKRRLESLVHPLIAALREDMITAGTGDPKNSAIILDSPLLLESNLDRLCHTVVFIEVSEAQRLQRLRQARGWDLEELRRRERWQMPLSEKRSRSHFTICNEGSIDQLRTQARDLFERILAEHSPNE
jgi:dephospho-CoA kinase